MGDRIYSAMDCGCFRYDNSDEWIVCKYHRQTSDLSGNRSKSYMQSQYFKLYVLQLKNHKYYIGLTARKNIEDRINEHRIGIGARWTQRYEPVNVVQTVNLGHVTQLMAENAENDLTLDYMKKYGKQNVRGGRNTLDGWILFKVYNTYSIEWLLSLYVKFLIIVAICAFAFYMISKGTSMEII